MKECARAGGLTGLDMAMVAGLDLAELHAFEKARELSSNLLKDWLVRYKFKGWVRTESRGTPVTAQMREQRALEVAHQLMDHEHWCSHGRPISMAALRSDLKLQIEDLDETPELSDAIHRYFDFISEVVGRDGADTLVHVPGACIR